jgi:hypothetical protein
MREREKERERERESAFVTKQKGKRTLSNEYGLLSGSHCPEFCIAPLRANLHGRGDYS